MGWGEAVGNKATRLFSKLKIVITQQIVITLLNNTTVHSGKLNDKVNSPAQIATGKPSSIAIY